MIPPEAIPNAVVDRRALRLELFIVLLVIWLPLFTSGVYWRNQPREHTTAGEFYGMASELGSIALILYLLWRNRESWRHLGLRRCRWWSELLWALLIYAAAWMAAITLNRWLSILFGDEPHARPSPVRRDLAFFFALGLGTLVAAAFEELFVRGYLWNRLCRLTGSKTVALFGSALLFTAYHPYTLRQLAFVLTFGLVLGLFHWRGRSLPRLILAHTLFNLSIFWSRYTL